MQKCTLSRIKSYEEKHYLESKKFLKGKKNSSNSSLHDINNNYKNNANIYIEKVNFKQFQRISKNNFSFSNKNIKISSDSTNFLKKKFKSNILKDDLFRNSKKYSERKKITSKKQKNYNMKQNIRIISNNLKYAKHNLLSTDNTTGGEIDISDNDDINEFNKEEKGNISNGHIPSLTNIFYFPKIFGNIKSLKENTINSQERKDTDFIRDARIIQNKKSTIETTGRHRIIREIGGTKNNVIVKLIQKNYSTNNSKKKIKNLQKLNFDQPNKNIVNQINNIEKEKNNAKDYNIIIKNIKNKASSYNNLNKISNVKEKLINKRNKNFIKNKSSSSYYVPLTDFNHEKKILKKSKKESLHKIQRTPISTPSKKNKIYNILQRTEELNKKMKNFKNNKNIPNIFIKNNIININNIKRPLTRYYNMIINDTFTKEDKNDFINTKNLKIRRLNMKQTYKSKIQNNKNNSSKENKDKNIPNNSHFNNYREDLINLNSNKQNYSINNNLRNDNMINNLKKNKIEINNDIFISCNKRIIKRINKTKIQEKSESNKVINLIYSKNNCSSKKNNLIVDNNNNVVKKIYSLKGKKLADSTFINYSNTYNTNFFKKKNYNDSQSDTDKEDNSVKKNYLSRINKNFDNAKKILNHPNKFKQNIENFLVIPKKINSCNNTKNNFMNKNLKNKIKNNLIYKAFIKYNIENFLDIKSLINLSLVNKRLYKKVRLSIFCNYYHKILKDKKCERNKLNIFRNIFIYASKELKYKNKLEIKEKYVYYSKKVKSKYKEEIIQDISRTFPNDIYFNNNIKKKLYNLLICYSNFNKVIGYAQGLNFVAASCLYFLKSEEEAFIFLDSFINRLELNNVLGIDNQKLIQKIECFDILLKKYIPDLNEFLISKLLNHDFFSMGWIISIFSNHMDKKKLMICWCFIVVFGWKFFYSFAIQVLTFYKDLIINSSETNLSSKMRTILNDEQFIKDFNLIIKNTLHFMVNHILL